VYERQLRERKADKNKAVTALKQRITALHNSPITAADEGQNKQPYESCLEAVKHIRQLYSPLLTSLDYYTLIHAAGLCVHERLLARLLEDAGIANVRLPSELFARLLQLLAPLDNPAAARCVVVVAHEYFRQQHVRSGDGTSGSAEGSRGDGQRLPLSAEQYGHVLHTVSRTSCTHLLLPLLHAFRHSSRRSREDIPLVCATVLPALRHLSQQQQHETLLSLSSAVLQWEVHEAWSGESGREVWGGSQLSDACEVLQLHFDALASASSSLFVDSSGRARSVSVAVPDSWRTHLPPLSELCDVVPSLRQYLSRDDGTSSERGGHGLSHPPSEMSSPDRL